MPTLAGPLVHGMVLKARWDSLSSFGAAASSAGASSAAGTGAFLALVASAGAAASRNPIENTTVDERTKTSLERMAGLLESGDAVMAIADAILRCDRERPPDKNCRR